MSFSAKHIIRKHLKTRKPLKQSRMPYRIEIEDFKGWMDWLQEQMK